MSDAAIVYGVVGVFLAVMLGVGVAAKRFVKDTDDFHRGGRQVPWWIAGLSIYMGAFSALAFVSYGSVVYTDGGVGILLGYGTVVAFVIAGVFFAPRWHRASLSTPVEYVERRFGPATRQFMAVVSLPMHALSSALRLFAFAMMMHGILDTPVVATIVVVGLCMAAVAIVGGLWGIVLADAVQFIIMLAGLVPLLIMSILALGGWDAFGQLAATDLLSVGRGDKGWNWLLTWWLLHVITGNFSLPLIQRFSSVPTEADARKAAFLAAGLLIPTPLLALIPVAVAFQLAPGVAPEMAFAYIAREVLPAGLLGLMVGAMIAATVSELETAFNIDSGILTRDIYQRWIRPAASAAHLLTVGRITTVASAVVAIGLAVVLAQTRTGIFNLSEAIASRVVLALTVPFVLGILIRRISERGFFLTVGVSALASVGLALAGWSSGEVRLPLAAVAFAALALGAVVFPPRDAARARIDRFFDQISLPNPAPAGARPAIDAATTALIGGAVCAVGVVPLLLPLIAGTAGPARWVEYGVAGFLFLVGGGLLLMRRLPAFRAREVQA